MGLEFLSTLVPIDTNASGVNTEYVKWTKSLRSVFEKDNTEIIEIVNSESKTSNQELHRRFETVIDTSLSVKTVLENGQDAELIYSGNASVVVLDSLGKVVHSQNLINAEVANDYGDDLRPVAYKKAVAAMALDVEYGSNMDNPSDFEMLQNFGYKFHKGGNKVSIDGEYFYIGVSGALPSEGYAKKVGILDVDSNKITESSLQGAFDSELCKLTEFYLNNPQKKGEAPIISRPEIVISNYSNQ